MGFPRVYLTKPLSLFGPINIASDAVRPNQAIIASFAVWLNQAIMSEWQMAMAKSPEVDSQESSVGLGQPLAMATDEFVNVKLPDESPQTWQCLVDHVAACFGQLCDAYGGPMQFLNHCYQDKAARQQFGDWLNLQLVSEKQPRDLMLAASVAARGVTVMQPYVVHPSALSFLPESSSKPAPYPRTAKLLADEILKNGFQSQHDHLIVHNPVEAEAPHPGVSSGEVEAAGPSNYGWLHYIKGAARSATLLVIVKLMLRIMGTGSACRFLNAELWETYCFVYVRWDLWQPDKRTVSFKNAQLSHAGSIREPNDLITWVLKLKALHDCGPPPH